jgi:hypothetical protein
MKKLILLIFILFSFNLFSQETIVFSIGVGYKRGLEEKVENHIIKNPKKYELVFICQEQKIFIVKIKSPFIDETQFLSTLNRKFKSQFIYKEITDITNKDCLNEYQQLH